MDETALLKSLSQDESPARRALSRLIVEHVLELPLASCVELEGLTPLVQQALCAANVERAIERHVLPGFRRVSAELAAAGEQVGHALPDAARAEITALASNPRGPRFAWLRGAVSPDSLRAVVGPVVQEVLVQFARNLPLAGGAADASGGSDPGGAAPRGLMGRLSREVGRSTGKLVSVGRSVADGLGVDLQGRLQDAARDYSQGATAVVQQAIRTRLQQPDGQKAVERIAQQVTAHVFGARVQDILEDADRLPLERAFRLAPSVIAHNVDRALVQGLIQRELQAFFALEGERSLRALLEEHGLLEPVQRWAETQVDRHARSLFTSDGFARWLGELFATPG